MQAGTLRRTSRAGILAFLLVGVAVAGLPSPASSSTVTLAAAGDIANGVRPNAAQQATANLIGQLAPTVLLPLGDTQYPDGSLDDYEASYDPTWGVYNSEADPVPGNHEYETPGAAGYYAYFGAPPACATVGADCSNAGLGYYSYNVGDWHLVALNDNCSDIDCAAETNWLRQDLVADGGAHLCDLVYRHKPNHGPFWKTLARNVKDASGQTVDHGVDVQLSGHRHVYARFAPVNGIRMIVAGTGGKSIGDLYSPAPSTLEAQYATFGILSLSLDAASYSGSFHAVDGTTPDDVPLTSCT